MKARKQKEADYNADSPGFLDDSDDGDGKAGGGKGTGKTKRNPKQQAQNKQAQQRWVLTRVTGFKLADQLAFLASARGQFGGLLWGFTCENLTRLTNLQ